jgi:hypothetical protein
MLTSKADWRWPKRCTQCLWITNLKDTTKWIFAESWGGRDNLCVLQGALGKTSGRSIFPNAPLRATSSAMH